LLKAASVGFLHTLTGPDHYLPFIVMGKARNGKHLNSLVTVTVNRNTWSSVVLGLIGVLMGVGIQHLNGLKPPEATAAWAFLILECIPCLWFGKAIEAASYS